MKFTKAQTTLTNDNGISRIEIVRKGENRKRKTQPNVDQIKVISELMNSLPGSMPKSSGFLCVSVVFCSPLPTIM